MFAGYRSLLVSCAAGFVFATLSCSSFGQPTDSASALATGSASALGVTTLIADETLPDAPVPQVTVAAIDIPDAPDAAQAAQTESGQQTSSSQSSSSAQSAPAQTGSQDESQHEKSEEQIKQEEKQRVLGVVPTFNTTSMSDAIPLTAGEKMNLAFHSAVDPFTFAAAFMAAGYHEIADDDPGFGWGPEGYFKRSGAAYLDAFDGAIIGNGILPSIFHQDPRYLRLGHGTFSHRLFYAIATSYICQSDKSRRWEPNFSNVGGNIISGAISNLYYPAQNSGWGQTITNGMIVTTEGTIGGVFDEFWPDVSRKLLHRDPSNGRDAQAREQDELKKQAKIQAKQQSSSSN